MKQIKEPYITLIDLAYVTLGCLLFVAVCILVL
jgi:hypothetical protein